MIGKNSDCLLTNPLRPSMVSAMNTTLCAIQPILIVTDFGRGT